MRKWHYGRGIKMYKAIICDDEEAVRNGLCKHFDWKNHSIKIIGVFNDGRPALEFVKNHEVDIIITDVRMLHMDGITLAKNAMELYPEVKTIFISGYADVHYLKDALKIEAVDYILKSIDLEELENVIAKVVGILNQKRNDRKIIQDMEKKLEKSMPLLKISMLGELLRDNEEEEAELEMRARFLDIPLNSKTSYAVMVMRIRHTSRRKILNHLTEKEKQSISLAVEELFSQELNRRCKSVTFKDSLLEYVGIIDVSGNQYEQDLLDVAEQLYRRIFAELKIEIFVGISEPFIGLSSVQKGYRDACEAISKSYLISKDVPISIKKYKDDSIKNLREHAEKEISDAILGGDFETVHKMLSDVMLYIRENENRSVQQNLMLFLLFLPTKLMNNMKTDDMGGYADQSRLTMDFLQCGDLNEQEDMLVSLYEEVTELLRKMSKPHTKTVINCVREIIEERYMEQLSVTSLAEIVNLTPAYLCVLFKQATGKTINEYLTQERLNHAKDLLTHSNIHLYDICYNVGYFSPSYFSRMFKKYVGVTPKEYRENILASVYTGERDDGK